MRKIKIDEISKDIFREEHIEDAEYFDYLIDESSAVNALDFFAITYEERTLIVPDAFDFEKAIKIVSRYLDQIEDSNTCEDIDAQRYNEHTKPTRGADDGTFDYAGTYVISILCVLQSHLNI